MYNIICPYGLATPIRRVNLLGNTTYDYFTHHVKFLLFFELPPDSKLLTSLYIDFSFLTHSIT